MTNPDRKLYVDREQTYVKHRVLKSYLERLVYKVGRKGGTLNYIDGFAGPWQSKGERLEDTSPHIAIRVLRSVRSSLMAEGCPGLRIRTMFIEEDAARCDTLSGSLVELSDVEAVVHQGEFEVRIPDAVAFAREGDRPFTFAFVDPCGWTGLGLRAITPLLQVEPGEVLINFMTNQINRFINDDQAKVAAQFEDLYGDLAFRDRLRRLEGGERQDAMVAEYCHRVREAGTFKHVVSAVVLNPHDDRAHFHLVYGTRHDEGLRTFREIERGMLGLQAKVRAGLQHEDRKKEAPGQGFLFAKAEEVMARPYVETLHDRYLDQARPRIGELLRNGAAVSFDTLAIAAMQIPMVSEQDARDVLVGARESGEVEFEGLKPRQRTPQWRKGHRVRSTSTLS